MDYTQIFPAIVAVVLLLALIHIIRLSFRTTYHR